MSNELIPTNGIWYKIRNLLKKLFFKQKTDDNVMQTSEIEKNNNIAMNENLKAKFEEESKKQILANQLICGEIEISELEETQVDEMIEYFTKDIQNIDNELLRIKQHILIMQRELKS